MGSIYEQLIDLLTNGANSPNLLITNRLQLVIGPQLAPDKVSQSLFEKSSLDDMTQSVLLQLCTVIKNKSKQLFKDFLENGKFCNPSETLAKKSEAEHFQIRPCHFFFLPCLIISASNYVSVSFDIS